MLIQWSRFQGTVTLLPMVIHYSLELCVYLASRVVYRGGGGHLAKYLVVDATCSLPWFVVMRDATAAAGSWYPVVLGSSPFLHAGINKQRLIEG